MSASSTAPATRKSPVYQSGEPQPRAEMRAPDAAVRLAVGGAAPVHADPVAGAGDRLDHGRIAELAAQASSSSPGRCW